MNYKVNQDFVNSFLGFDPFNLGEKEVPFNYPPHNVYTLDSKTYIEVAVAGFSRDELEVVTENGILTISGEKPTSAEKRDEREVAKKYSHKGISTRKFKKQFSLYADTKVLDADVTNGVLTVTLERTQPVAVNRIKIK